MRSVVIDVVVTLPTVHRRSQSFSSAVEILCGFWQRLVLVAFNTVSENSAGDGSIDSDFLQAFYL